MHSPEINLSLTAMKKGNTSSTNYQAAFCELRDKYREYEPIYTDGSHLNNRTASAAVKGNHCYAERLADEATIYTAELHALYLAQDHVETSTSDKHLVCSDSKSSLVAMETKKWKHPLVRKLLVRHPQLTEQGKEIVYIWVPGHMGIRGNDLADTAAKNATDLQPSRDAEIPSSDLKRSVNCYIHRKWQTEWDSKIGNKLHSIQPSIGIYRDADRMTKKDQVVISRLRIGHTRLTHAFEIKKEPQPVCTRCQDPLTVKHILIDCQQCPVRDQYHKCRTLRELFETCNPETILNYIKQLGIYYLI